MDGCNLVKVYVIFGEICGKFLPISVFRDASIFRIFLG